MPNSIFDFTEVREPGMYQVHYRDVTTEPFAISRDVYRNSVWQPTLETYIFTVLAADQLLNGPGR